MPSDEVTAGRTAEMLLDKMSNECPACANGCRPGQCEYTNACAPREAHEEWIVEAINAAASRARREALEEAANCGCLGCRLEWPLNDTGDFHTHEVIGETHCHTQAIRDLASDEASDGEQGGGKEET